MSPPAVALIPALDAASTIGDIVTSLVKQWPTTNPQLPAVIVVDDGSRDASAEIAESAGAHVVRHRCNLGKGAALRTGLLEAARLGAAVAVSIDADGQHPVAEAVRFATHPAAPDVLLLGARDLVRDGAPRTNRFGNRTSNFFINYFSQLELSDTQCGLRRYPVRRTLELWPLEDGFGFEAEVILRAARAGWTVLEEPVRVVYSADSLRFSHFRTLRDPLRIVFRVAWTLLSSPRAPTLSSQR